MTTELKEVIAYTDGSSRGNGQANPRAASAAVLACGARVKAFAEYLGGMTNQQAELRAATLAVRSLKEPCRLTLFTDSKYVVETMRGNYRRKANLDLWGALDEAIRRGGHRVEFVWTRGHATGDERNARQEASDQLAQQVALAGRVEEHMLAAAVRRFAEAGATATPPPPPAPATAGAYASAS